MKLTKPILLFVGVLIAIVMFAFKNEDQSTEYAMMRVYGGTKKEIIIYFENQEPQEYILKKAWDDLDKEAFIMVTKLKNDGWRIISTDLIYTTSIGMPYRYYHFERRK